MLRTTPLNVIGRTEPLAKQRFALAVLCLAQFGVVLAYQGTTISLPNVERSFNLSVSTSQWLVSINALTFGGLLLPAGRAADLFGHRRLFLFGSALFGAASLAAGLAPTVEWLIAARAFQGVGTACFTPAMIALLADIFPEGAERNRALAFWSAAGPVGGVSAILMGGALASAMGWRAVFVLGTPITFAVVFIAFAVLPPGRARSQGRFDPLAALVGTIGVGVVVYSLGLLADSGLFAVRVVGWFAAGAILLGIFVHLEHRSSTALIPRSLRGRKEIWRPIGVAFSHGASTNTPIVFYALFMQHYRDASPWEIGIGFLPCNLAIIVASPSATKLARRVGYRLVMATGMIIVMAGLLVLTTLSAGDRYLETFLPAWFLLGLGLGLAQVGIVGAATDQATAEERGVVGGLVNTAEQLGTALGLAVLVTIANWPANDIDGYRAAFAGAGILALLGLLVALAPVKHASR